MRPWMMVFALLSAHRANWIFMLKRVRLQLGSAEHNHGI